MRHVALGDARPPVPSAIAITDEEDYEETRQRERGKPLPTGLRSDPPLPDFALCPDLRCHEAGSIVKSFKAG